MKLSGCDMNDYVRFTVSHVQSRGRTALMWASEGGYLDVVKEVLRAQAGVDMEDEVCLWAVVQVN